MRNSRVAELPGNLPRPALRGWNDRPGARGRFDHHRCTPIADSIERRRCGTRASPSCLETSRAPLYAGGTIALVQEGDSITIDAHRLLIQLNVDDAELARRRAAWKPPAPRYTRVERSPWCKRAIRSPSMHTDC